MKLGEAKLGKVLVGPDGRTLYGFTNDTAAKSTCSGACALAWPPAIVDASWSAGPGLDTGIFATTVRDDGALQLVAGKWPLYYFEGDATAGDTNGQGSGDVWFVVAPDARLVKEGAATTPGYGRVPEPATPAQAAADKPTVSLVDSSFGGVVADADGRALYAFTKDEAGTPTCTGGCATAWPAASAPTTLVAGDGVEGSKLATVARPDGAADQLKLGRWPLYYFAGDAGAGGLQRPGVRRCLVPGQGRRDARQVRHLTAREVDARQWAGGRGSPPAAGLFPVPGTNRPGHPGVEVGMKTKITGSLVVCIAAAAFTAGALVLNDDGSNNPAPVAAGSAPSAGQGYARQPGATGGAAAGSAAPIVLEVRTSRSARPPPSPAVRSWSRTATPSPTPSPPTVGDSTAVGSTPRARPPSPRRRRPAATASRASSTRRCPGRWSSDDTRRPHPARRRLGEAHPVGLRPGAAGGGRGGRPGPGVYSAGARRHVRTHLRSRVPRRCRR